MNCYGIWPLKCLNWHFILECSTWQVSSLKSAQSAHTTCHPLKEISWHLSKLQRFGLLTWLQLQPTRTEGGRFQKEILVAGLFFFFKNNLWILFADNETTVSQDERRSLPSPGTDSETSAPDNHHQSIVQPRQPSAVRSPLVIDIEVSTRIL